MWSKHFSALLSSSKNCEIGNFVHQNIISHGNFEGIDELMFNSFKIKISAAQTTTELRSWQRWHLC